MKYKKLFLPAGSNGTSEELWAAQIGEEPPAVHIHQKERHLLHVELTYTLKEAVRQDTCCVYLAPSFKPEAFWSFHLTPEEGCVADQHVFRTPAIMALGRQRTIILLPDIETADTQGVHSYMDMDAENNRLYYGLGDTEVYGHILYRKTHTTLFPAGEIRLNFYIMLFDERLENPYRPVLEFYWNHFGAADYREYWGAKGDLLPYVAHTYTWAFQNWKDRVWQEFELDGKKVGAPAFIVTTAQSPNYPGIAGERETRSIWNQAWFCSLRSASGLFRYARRYNDGPLLEKARMTKELALAFPQDNGLFDSVIATEMESFEAQGTAFARSKGWDTKYFGNSNRNPFTRDLASSPRHILDMSFTAYYMLLWYRELEADERLRDYAGKYADRLLSLQLDSGFFPGWVDAQGKAMGILDDSPETAMSAVFLLLCYRVFGDERYRTAAKRAMNTVLREITPEGRYEDFETFWSCSGFQSDYAGEKIGRNALYKQCNLSMYYTALGALELYEDTADEHYLTAGRRVLDELLMTQSSYQPRGIKQPVIGGFGVMNSDAELLDSRQSLFAELLYRYGKALHAEEYRERALAALRASFSMMYCPENPEMKEQWEKAWPFLNEKDYGFTMENYGHNGTINGQGDGIGEFTIYDWGNGAAAEAFMRMLDHYADEILY